MFYQQDTKFFNKPKLYIYIYIYINKHIENPNDVIKEISNSGYFADDNIDASVAIQDDDADENIYQTLFILPLPLLPQFTKYIFLCLNYGS